jgi:hypothetical protein
MKDKRTEEELKEENKFILYFIFLILMLFCGVGITLFFLK